MITERVVSTVNSLRIVLFILFINSGPNTRPVTLALGLDKPICVYIPVRTPASCVMLDKLLNLSDPYFLSDKTRIIVPISGLLLELNRMIGINLSDLTLDND